MLPDKVTIGDKYRPAMEITEQAAADAYFEECVEHVMRICSLTREEAEKCERSNLGYFAGYYDHEMRARVERLFKCAHPVFGAIADKGAPTAEEALLPVSRGVAKMLKRSATRSRPYVRLSRSSGMKRTGKKSKRNLKLVSELKRQATKEGWIDRCEIGPILMERGLTTQGCFGDLTMAHSVKYHKRLSNPVLDRETARSCEYHHFFCLDELKPALTKEIVRDAIARRRA